MKLFITFLLLLSPFFTTLHADYCDDDIDLSNYDTGDYLSNASLSINTTNSALRVGKNESYTAASGLYYDGDVYLRPGSTFTGDIYATGAIVVRNGATLDGNAYAEGDFRLNDSGTISNDDDSKTIGVISGDFCESGNSLTELPVAQLIGQCNAIFKDAAQSFDEAGTLTMWSSNARISDDVYSFDFKNINGGQGSENCIDSVCSVTGNSSTQLSSFSMLTVDGDNINAYSWLDPSDITLGASSDAAGEYAGTVFGDLNVNGASITFLEQADPLTDHYQINSINLAEGTATLNLNPGVYAVNSFSAPGGGIINIVGDGDVYLFINSPPTGMKLTVLGDPDNMNLIFNSPIQFYSETSISGSVYVNGQLTMDGSANISGRVAAENLTMNSSTKITNASVCGSDVNTYSLEIVTSPDALTCEPHILQVNVADENGDPASDYTESITLSSDSTITTWSVIDADGTLTDNGDGSATYEFVASDQGSVEFALSNQVAGDVVVTVTDGTETATSDTITFHSALIKTELTCNNTIDNTCVHIANQPFSLKLTAFKENESTTLCESYDPTGIKFWSEYITPDSGTKAVEVNLTEIGVTELTALELPLAFSAGVATVAVNYPDAGRININVSDADNSAIQGVVEAIINPLALRISQVLGYTNSTGSGKENPATEDSGDAFIRASKAVYDTAGNPDAVDTFTLEVQGTIDCSDDTNNHCDTDNAENNIAPNFFNGSEDNDVIQITPTLAFPAAGTLGGFYSPSGVTPATFKTTSSSAVSPNFSYSEAGSINLQASTENYLLTGNSIASEGDTLVGRFYPDYIALTEGSFRANATATCSTDIFSYIGDPTALSISYQLTANAQLISNTETIITTNYDDDLAYPVAVSGDIDQFAYNQSEQELTYYDGADERNRIFATEIYNEALWSEGQYNSDPLSTTQFKLGLKRLVNNSDEIIPDGPFDSGDEVNYRIKLIHSNEEKLQISSTELCDNDICKLGNLSELRYGRLQAGNGYGSEFSPIRVLIEETYFNGSEFIAVDSDSCTPLIADQISISTTVYTPSYSILNNPLISGKGYLQFSASNDPGTLSYYIRLKNEGTSLYTPWLLDSGNTVTCSSDAGGLEECISGQVQFGFYRGNDRVINRMQTFN